jgi:tungstate transport system ATP-binding protein
VLELRGVQHRYEGRLVLDLERFVEPRCAMVPIVASNVSGKNPALRLLALLERPTTGTVWFDGHPARHTAVWRRRVTLVEQRPILFRGTVRENLEYGLTARGLRRTAVSSKLETVAERLGIASLLGRQRRELSEERSSASPSRARSRWIPRCCCSTSR